MKLSELAARYVAHKQSMGMRFCTEARTLKSFCRSMGDIAITEVHADRVHAYIAGTGPVTRFWHRKHQVLRGFYPFAIARRYVTNSPLPAMVPKPPRAFVPHIYSHDELRRLLEVTVSCDNPRSKIEADTCRTLILLLIWCRFANQRGARAHADRRKYFDRYPSHSGEQILQDTTCTTQP